jgi:signal transduction histidine kinase
MAGELTMAIPQTSIRRGSALALQVALSALAGFITTLLWVLTGAGYFWPGWVWLGLGTAVGVHLVILRALSPEPEPYRALRIHAEATANIAAIYFVIWALSGGGDFWPVWPLSVFLTALAVHAVVVWHRPGREQALEERVDELTRTRRGAVDVQAAELRRIERDLHDGAQARLVALTMNLGRAEERLGDRPEVAGIVREARADASAAIAELRDLARGIAPPVLADRGLAAAVEALGQRLAIPVTVDARPGGRLPPIVESVAYFVVAESLTNAAKHAGGAAHVTLARSNDSLLVAVADGGPGGADADGGGLSGLRHRVEAIDGALRVHSPPGGGTTIYAELPCGS